MPLDKAKADKLRYKVEDKFVKIFITPYRTSISEKDLQFSEGDFNVDVVLALGVHKQQDLDQAITAHGRILHDATIIAVNTQPNNELGSVNLVEQQASSLSEIAVELLNMLDKSMIDDQVATALLTGIVAETDRFRNAKTTPATMSTSAGLLTAGANQQLVASKLEAKPPESSNAKSDTAKASESPKPEKKPNDGTLEIQHEEVGDNKPPESTEPKEPTGPLKPPQIHIDEDGHVHDLEEHKDVPSNSNNLMPSPAPVAGIGGAPLFTPPPLNPFGSSTLPSAPTPTPPPPLAPPVPSSQMPPMTPPPVMTPQLPTFGGPSTMPMGGPAAPMSPPPALGGMPPMTPAPASALNPFASSGPGNDLGLPPMQPMPGGFGQGGIPQLPTFGGPSTMPMGGPAAPMSPPPALGGMPPMTPLQPLAPPVPSSQMPPMTPPPVMTPPVATPPLAQQGAAPEIIQPDPNVVLAQQQREEAELPPPPSNEPPTIKTEGPRLMTQPPTFGSELTAGTMPQVEDEDVPSGGALNLPQVEKAGLLLNREPLQPTASPVPPLGVPSSSPALSTLPPPPLPKVEPPATPAPAGAPIEPSLLAEESLSSLERDVKSPHLDYIESPAPNLPGSSTSSTSTSDPLASAAVMKPATSPEEDAAAAISAAADAQQVDDVADARSAIKDAFGDPLEPVASLNAQPLGAPLHEDDNALPPGFSNDPNSGGTLPPPPVPPPLIPPTPS